MTVTLRRARWWDRWYVLRLRNSADVLAAGAESRIVGRRWWGVVKPWMRVIMYGVNTAGYVIVTPTGMVSIALEHVARHQGIGTEALKAVRAVEPGVLTAIINADNIASVRAFERAGFKHEGQRDRQLLFRSAP